MSEKIFLNSHICPVCGREFFLHCEAREYAYKTHLQHRYGHSYTLYCSYKCLRLAQANKIKKKHLEVIDPNERVYRCKEGHKIIKLCHSVEEAEEFFGKLTKENEGKKHGAYIIEAKEGDIIISKKAFKVKKEINYGK